MPQDKVYWYFEQPATEPFNRLITEIETDVVIVGGGMAGLTAAQSFKDLGLEVVLIEKEFCGAGASGKSSGFITPNSEYGLEDLVSKFGKADSKKLWDFATSGANLILDNIKKYNIDCDYDEQDTLMLANSESKFKSDLLPEYNVRNDLGYDAKVYNKQELSTILGSDKYFGGISYSGSFGINSYKYCQNMSKVLQQLGVKIFEKSEVTKIEPWGVETAHGHKVKAKYIIVCIDRFLPELKKLSKDIYHVQTFLMISNKLTQEQVKKIFPEKKYMTWDTDLIYQYWRLTGDNKLLIGGSNILYSYAWHEKHNSSCVYKKLNNYFKNKFPDLDIDFEYIWPGFIGVSKDVIPVAGIDSENKNIYYISAATGLPWAAALGQYSAKKLIENRSDFDEYFSPSRKYPVNRFLQTILGKRLTFAISNFFSLKSI